jgi:Coenzyme PQQ synthesis protein D (PqqD)
MTEPLPARIQVSPEVMVQELDGESVLLDLKSELYYGLDDVGTRMWQHLAERGDPAAACARIVAEYSADEATVRRDLAELIGKLAAAGLVTVGDPIGGGGAADQAP